MPWRRSIISSILFFLRRSIHLVVAQNLKGGGFKEISDGILPQTRPLVYSSQQRIRCHVAAESHAASPRGPCLNPSAHPVQAITLRPQRCSPLAVLWQQQQQKQPDFLASFPLTLTLVELLCFFNLKAVVFFLCFYYNTSCHTDRTNELRNCQCFKIAFSRCNKFTTSVCLLQMFPNTLPC